MTWANTPINPRIFVVWDPIIVNPISTQWDGRTKWDGGLTVWDSGTTVWGDATTTWVE